MTTTSIASIVKTWVNNTTTEFPVDFDLLWQGLGYSTKASALRGFERSRLIEKQDYIILTNVESVNHKGFSAQEKAAAARLKKIMFTVDAAKAFCMMSETEAGKIVRSYFLQCERELKRIMVNPPVKTLSRVELLELASESLARELALYNSNKPGLIAHYESTTHKQALIPGKRTLKQIVDGYGATVELGMLSSLGRHIASVYRDLWHEEPDTTWEDGRNVAAYPFEIDKCVETWLRGRGYIN